MSKIIGIDLNPEGCSIAVLDETDPVIIGRLPADFSVKGPHWFKGVHPEADSVFSVSAVLWKLGKREGIRLGKVVYPPKVLLSVILLELKRMAEDYLGKKVHEAVVTVPGSFDYNAKRDIEKTRVFTGLEIRRILKHSSAYGLWNAYSLKSGRAEIIGCMDINPFCWELCLLGTGNGIMKELVSGGGRFSGQVSSSKKDKVLYWLSAVEQMNTVFREFPYWYSDHKPYRVVLSENGNQFDELIDYVKKMTGRTPVLLKRINEAYAKGAAISGGILGGESAVNDLLCLTCCSKPYSIRVAGDQVKTLINAYSPLPIQYSEVFSTFADYQRAIDIYLLYGGAPKYTDNVLIEDGFFRINIPPFQKKGVPKIEVTLGLDENEHLSVTAKNADTDQKLQVHFSGQPDLSEQEIDQWNSMLKGILLQKIQPDFPPIPLLQDRLSIRPDVTVTDLFEHILPILDALDASLGCMTPELYEEPYVLFFVNLHKNMLKALEREGLHAIPDTGHPFDYHCHKAVSSVKNPMFPSGTVIRAFRTGYEYRGKVLRFSEVEVAE